MPAVPPLAAPVELSKPCSITNMAFRPPPRSSVPLKPMRDELLFIELVEVEPSLIRSMVVFRRP